MPLVCFTKKRKNGGAQPKRKKKKKTPAEVEGPVERWTEGPQGMTGTERIQTVKRKVSKKVKKKSAKRKKTVFKVKIPRESALNLPTVSSFEDTLVTEGVGAAITQEKIKQTKAEENRAKVFIPPMKKPLDLTTRSPKTITTSAVGSHHLTPPLRNSDISQIHVGSAMKKKKTDPYRLIEVGNVATTRSVGASIFEDNTPEKVFAKGQNLSPSLLENIRLLNDRMGGRSDPFTAPLYKF